MLYTETDHTHPHPTLYSHRDDVRPANDEIQ